MTVAMILALARNFPLHCEDFRAGLWQQHIGYLLSEWTIGLRCAKNIVTFFTSPGMAASLVRA